MSGACLAVASAKAGAPVGLYSPALPESPSLSSRPSGSDPSRKEKRRACPTFAECDNLTAFAILR